MQKQTEGKTPTNPDPSAQSKFENRHSRIQHTILKTPVLLNTEKIKIECNGGEMVKTKTLQDLFHASITTNVLFSSSDSQQSSMSDTDPIRNVGPPSRGPECCSPPTPRMELLSPSKVKDRSQNVTEKVTQVRSPKSSVPLQSLGKCGSCVSKK